MKGKSTSGRSRPQTGTRFAIACALLLACGTPDPPGGGASADTAADTAARSGGAGDADARAEAAADTAGVSGAAADNRNDTLRSAGVDAAADVIRRYYDAIRAHDYASAYRLWSSDGGASGQSLDAFARGFEQTAQVEVDIGDAGPIEAAAGSRYVEVAVVVRAMTASGQRQRFEGSYTLRRSVVTGANADQRAWRIYSAQLRPAGT